MALYGHDLGRHRSAAIELGNALLAVRTLVQVDFHKYGMLAVTLVATNVNLIGRHRLFFITVAVFCQRSNC